MTVVRDAGTSDWTRSRLSNPWYGINIRPAKCGIPLVRMTGVRNGVPPDWTHSNTTQAGILGGGLTRLVYTAFFEIRPLERSSSNSSEPG